MISVISSIELRNGWWLLLALQPLLMFVFAMLLRRLRRDEFADVHLLPWVRSVRTVRRPVYVLRSVALLLAWALLAVAMAGPRIAEGTIDTGEEQAIEVQAVVDLSRSMSARDVMPSRIERSRLELTDFIQRMQQVRLGLIVYAARAHVMLPATTDKAVLRHGVSLLDTRQLPTAGSDLPGALRFAAQQFQRGDQPRAILLISDGELPDGAARVPDDLLIELKQANIRLFVLGMGTAQGAPLLSEAQGWLQHEGRAVVTQLHAERLQALADGGNGRYAEVSEDDADWQMLYDDGIARLQAFGRETRGDGNILWRDLSAWFVLPGLVLLLLAYARLSFRPQVVAMLVFGSVVAGMHSTPAQAAAVSYAEAYALYARGEYQAAAKQFAQLRGYAARLAEGASYYQAQAWQQAAASFIQATLDADSAAQRAQALFNLGNTYFKQAAYTEAAQVYRDVLRYMPQWRAAQTNLDYALALQQQALEELPVATREGKGARSARVADDVEIIQGRLSIDGSTSETQSELALPESTDTPDSTSRLQQAAPAAAKIERDADIRWSYEITSSQALQPQHTHFDVDEGVIWQRLYESEEGFAAPQEQPHVLPGVVPW